MAALFTFTDTNKAIAHHWKMNCDRTKSDETSARDSTQELNEACCSRWNPSSVELVAFGWGLGLLGDGARI